MAKFNIFTQNLLAKQLKNLYNYITTKGKHKI